MNQTLPGCDGRDSEEHARGGSSLGGRVVVYYLFAGAVLAILRIALIVWGNQHKGLFAQWNLYWVFYPEDLLYHTSFRPTGYIRRTALFVVGSYVIATPLLAAGWLLGRQTVMRYLSCGAALAILRVAVLVSVNDFTKAEWSIPWVLYPEALLLIHTPLGYLGRHDSSFVFATLLAVGSFVMATPILLVGWLMRHQRIWWGSLPR